MSKNAIKRKYLKAKLRTLSLLAPKRAGKIATEQFIKSRNESNLYRKAFAPLGAKTVSLRTTSGKVTQAYVWGDEGNIVLLLHGWGANCASMFSFVPYLQRAGFRVATFDAPAHGSSEGEFASMMEYMQDSIEVIQQLGSVTKLVAHSLGSIIATAVAAKTPAIDQCVLISSPYSLVDVLEIWSRGFMKLNKRVEQRVFTELFNMNGVPVDHWTIALHSKNLDIPVLIIHDENDPIVNVSHLSRIADTFRFPTSLTTHNLGHMKILSSQEVHQETVDFFGRTHLTAFGETVA